MVILLASIKIVAYRTVARSLVVLDGARLTWGSTRLRSRPCTLHLDPSGTVRQRQLLNHIPRFLHTIACYSHPFFEHFL